MVDFFEKARQGRIAAVASMSANPRGIAEIGPNGQRNRSSNRHQNVVFVSARMRQGLGATIG